MVPVMNKTLKTLLLPMTMVLMFTSGAGLSAENCLSNREIRQEVVDRHILSLGQIKSRAGIGYGSKVLQPVNVCRNGGELYYHLSILDKSGKAYKLVLHAVTGAS